MVSSDINDTLNGAQLLAVARAGAQCLSVNAEAINALNVFPVPDGDTGINMLLTLKSAIEAAETAPADSTTAEIARLLARGALLGARGNSGVIFSQFIKGISTALADTMVCDGATLARALASAAAAGYQAVGKPVEGTMLSVMRAAADAVDGKSGSVPEVLSTALEAAEQALARTPEQLPVLKEAGVVDAGGQGVVAFLAGALAYLRGEDPAIRLLAGTDGVEATVSQTYLEHSADDMYGYCTQFVVLGEGLDVDALRSRVMDIADSTVVIGDDRTIRVHAHAADPGPLLSLGVAFGTVDQVKIENMDLQHQGFMAAHGYSRERKVIAVVAVSPGPGLDRVFRGYGASVVQGGQTMNPSAQELLDAVKRANAEHVILLPNNKNVILAANQAAGIQEGIHVVPSRSVPQGIAALLRFNPELSLEENLDRMTEALEEVVTGEVTTAVRTTTVAGTRVNAGEAMALLNDELVATAASPGDALAAMLERAAPEPGTLVTLYYGKDISAAEAEKTASTLSARFAGIEAEVIEGGQPHYHYIVSIE